jgi:hypothetical protein
VVVRDARRTTIIDGGAGGAAERDHVSAGSAPTS